ncbi:uncharacterized protein LOC133696183 [Populus nigra]|uniref:uncharacterized protein LOC133696183 n=1 Tax=Populus nigra TaxID=3691 RepID=UPI002B27C078|nr:uncharacterized protein LOC133696183 [Populus nigra]
MEIPVINRISDFETGISSLQNPSFLSQIFALSGAEKIHQAYSFWKWGALLLALVASFTTIINRIKILVIRFKNHPFISSPSLITNQEDGDYESETDLSCSSSISLSDEEQEEEPPSTSRSWWSIDDHDEDFCVRGSGNRYIDDEWQNGNFRLRRRRNSSIGDFFSLSDFTNERNVVKLWDNLGLGLGFNLNNGSDSRSAVVSFYDINNERNICSIFGSKCDSFTAVSPSPSVVVSAETNLSGHSSLNLWDSRVGFRMPEVFAELGPMLGKIVGVGGGGGGGAKKVYVRDDVTGELTVGDIRKVSSPLVNVTESDVDTWWDADAVIVEDECEKSV